MADKLAVPLLPIETQIFTFYSFKGGVGRSMALVNLAAQLAQGKRRVLAIDLDLEAPGLSYLALKKGRSPARGGFVDLIYDFLTEQEKSPLGDPNATNPFADYCVDVDLSDTAQGEDGGTVCVMPAGDLNRVGEYQRRMSYLELGRLYREGLGAPILAHFKKRLVDSKLYDYVLIDSRTGFSAESTIAVRDLADHLVVVMGLNHQNVEGTSSFLRALHGESQHPKTLTVVISPIPLGEDDLATQRIEIARKELIKAWPSSGYQSFGEIRIPYHPRLALDEEPHKQRLTNQPLTQAYRNIHSRVRRLAKDSPEDYAEATMQLLKQSSAVKALPYLVRLTAAQHHLADHFTREALKVANDEKTQTSLIGLLRPQITSSVENAEAVASLRRDADDHTGADKIWTLYLEKHPDDARAWMARGVMLEGSPKKAKATRCLQRATKYASENTWIWNRYACHLWEVRGKTQEASDAFTHWLSLNPTSSTECGNFAEFCIAENRLEEAKQFLEQAWERKASGAWEGHQLFCAALYSLLQGDKLGEVKQLRRIAWGLEKGMRLGATVKALLKKISLRLKNADNQFYATLARMITGEEVQPFALLRSPKWKSIKPEKPIGPLF